MRRIDRLRALSMRDFVLLGQLVGLSCTIAVALRLVGWRRVAELIIARSRTKWMRHFPLPQLTYTVEQLNPLVAMAGCLFPRNRCLISSMVRLWLLRARGESAEVVLGVRKRAGVFEAHAWTLSEGVPVGEHPDALADFETMMTSTTSEQL
jgi:hypothetical protein